MVDYNNIKHTFTTVDILRDFFHQHQPKEKGFYRCPSGHGSESGKSFTIKGNKFKCWSCGKGGSAINLLTEFNSMSFPEAIQACVERYAPHLQKELPTTQKYLALEHFKQIQKQFVETLKNPKALDFTENYLAKRNLPNIIEKYGVGFSKDLEDNDLNDYCGVTKKGFYFTKNRITIPIYKKGTLIGFTMRAVVKGHEPKYLNIYNKIDNPYSTWLFGLKTGMKEITLTEGVFDALTLTECGLNGVATLGTALNAERIELLRRCDKITLAFDNDLAGKNAVLKFFKLSKLPTQKICVIDLPRNDCNDCTHEELETAERIPLVRWIAHNFPKFETENEEVLAVQKMERIQEEIKHFIFMFPRKTDVHCLFKNDKIIFVGGYVACKKEERILTSLHNPKSKTFSPKKHNDVYKIEKYDIEDKLLELFKNRLEQEILR